MTGPVEPQKHRMDRTGPQAKPRRLWITLLAVIPALFAAGTAGAFWTGYSLHDRPFAWYNSNRIAATARPNFAKFALVDHHKLFWSESRCGLRGG